MGNGRRSFSIVDIIHSILISLFNVEIIGQIFDSFVRTVAMSLLGVVVIYKLRISKQINDIIDKVLSLLKLTKK